jgi:hypothetical protein
VGADSCHENDRILRMAERTTAARLYAVEPVGVAMQTPSAWTEVKCSSSPNISVEDIALSY